MVLWFCCQFLQTVQSVTMVKSKACKAFLIFFQIILLACSVYPRRRNIISGGKCPDFPSQKDFSTSRFQGVWFITHQFESYQRRFSECQVFNITATSDSSMKIAGSTRFILSTLSLDTDGQSFAPNKTNPAVMVWKWDSSPLTFDYVTVVDTDYDNYALIVDCLDFGVFHKKYAILLSREQYLEETEAYTTYMNKAKSVIPYPLERQFQYLQYCYLDTYYPKNETKVQNLNIDETVSSVMDFVSHFI